MSDSVKYVDVRLRLLLGYCVKIRYRGKFEAELVRGRMARKSITSWGF